MPDFSFIRWMLGLASRLPMTSLAPPSVPLSQLGRAAHDLGLAGLLGGNLYGRLALHPGVTEISDAAERGKVVNAAWRGPGSPAVFPPCANAVA